MTPYYQQGKAVNWREHVGHRCIAFKNCPRYKLEVIVIETSPSGKYVKFQFYSGSISWESSGEWLLVEELA